MANTFDCGGAAGWIVYDTILTQLNHAPETRRFPLFDSSEDFALLKQRHWRVAT